MMAFESAILYMREIHGRIESIEYEIKNAQTSVERLTRLKEAFLGFTSYYYDDDESVDSDDDNFKDIEDRRYVPHTGALMDKFATWTQGVEMEEGLDDLKKAFCDDMVLLKNMPDFESMIFRDELFKVYKGELPQGDLTSEDVVRLQAEV
jgi:hypothetical protein